MEEAGAKEFLIVDIETGDVVGNLFEGDKIVPKHIGQRLKENIGWDNRYINMNRRYVKYFDGMAEQLAVLNLTSTEIIIMLYLAEHTRTGSGAILHGNNQPVTRGNIIKRFSICEKTVNKAFKKLEAEGIIARSTTAHKEKYFYNPYVLMRGRYVNKTLYQMFCKTKWYELDRADRETHSAEQRQNFGAQSK